MSWHLIILLQRDLESPTLWSSHLKEIWILVTVCVTLIVFYGMFFILNAFFQSCIGHYLLTLIMLSQTSFNLFLVQNTKDDILNNVGIQSKCCCSPLTLIGLQRLVNNKKIWPNVHFSHTPIFVQLFHLSCIENDLYIAIKEWDIKSWSWLSVVIKKSPLMSFEKE